MTVVKSGENCNQKHLKLCNYVQYVYSAAYSAENWPALYTCLLHHTCVATENKIRNNSL